MAAVILIFLRALFHARTSLARTSLSGYSCHGSSRPSEPSFLRVLAWVVRTCSRQGIILTLTVFLLCSVPLSRSHPWKYPALSQTHAFGHQGDWVGDHGGTSSSPSPPVENGSNHMALWPGATQGIRVDKGHIVITDKAQAARTFSISLSPG